MSRSIRRHAAPPSRSPCSPGAAHERPSYDLSVIGTDGQPGGCRICSGELAFARAGRGSSTVPSGFVPTCHRPGDHGDLYRCRDCGTVQQPSLPRGTALYRFYREMHDDGYLAEEEGRRRTARRLLDMLEPRAPGARLLEVGCGHGLLLDEARSRGYAVKGLDLSAEAVRFAREELKLPVEEAPVEEAVPEGDRFDAIV